MKSTHTITNKDYSTEGRALAAAKRIFKTTRGYLPGGKYWNMDNVTVRQSSYGDWHWYLVWEDEPAVEDAMPEGLKMALADAFFRQQAGRAELERRRAERTGLAGSGFRPRF